MAKKITYAHFSYGPKDEIIPADDRDALVRTTGMEAFLKSGTAERMGAEGWSVAFAQYDTDGTFKALFQREVEAPAPESLKPIAGQDEKKKEEKKKDGGK